MDAKPQLRWTWMHWVILALCFVIEVPLCYLVGAFLYWFFVLR